MSHFIKVGDDFVNLDLVTRVGVYRDQNEHVWASVHFCNPDDEQNYSDEDAQEIIDSIKSTMVD